MEGAKVFDVAKPGRAAPSPTSRPIITPQKTAGIDSMVKDDPMHEEQPESSSSTPIHVAMADEDPINVATNSMHSGTSSFDSGQDAPPSPGVSSSHEEQSIHTPVGATIPPHELEDEPQQSDNQPGSNFTPLSTLIPTSNSKEDSGEYGSHHVDNLPESHDGDPGWHEAPPLPISHGAGPKRRWPKIIGWLLVLTILVLAGGFLAIDAGLVKSDIKLPFHIFNKQKTSSAVTPTPIAKSPQPVSQPPAQSATPNGFVAYTLEGTKVNFAYPAAWGTPAVTKDPGFSKRGGTNKTDGTHAYLVDFATNKDVQIALTSSKYLPAARGALYYDLIQWCLGTNDNKFYLQQLKFATADKVDTPSTITCDQGPLVDATKLNESTIVQLKTKDAAGTVLGDLYTDNLTSNTDLPVLRVKDATMKNSDDIKKLLATVKISSNSAAQ